MSDKKRYKLHQPAPVFHMEGTLGEMVTKRREMEKRLKKVSLEDQWFNFWSAMADSVMDASDEEMQAEIDEEGDDSDEVRRIFVEAVAQAENASDATELQPSSDSGIPRTDANP